MNVVLYVFSKGGSLPLTPILTVCVEPGINGWRSGFF
jgi:hypothetical protein